MQKYDTTFVLNPQLEESGLDNSIKDIVAAIGATGGTMVQENRIGMRRLAYEINKLTQGYYVSLVYEGTGDTVREIERKFRLDENCLRFLTCHYREMTNKILDSRSPEGETTDYKKDNDKPDEAVSEAKEEPKEEAKTVEEAKPEEVKAEAPAEEAEVPEENEEL